MSEEKAVCANPECGNDVSDNVKTYSLDNYGVILCYPCQELVRSGKLDVEALKEVHKKKSTLEGYTIPPKDKADDDELEEFGQQLEGEQAEEEWKKGEEGEVVDADVAGEEEEAGKQKLNKTVEIDEGTFSFWEEAGRLFCKNGANDNIYELKGDTPECSCRDFLVNKNKNEWCKHLKAAKVAGYDVKKLPKVPVEVAKALAVPEKKTHRKTKAKKEETMALTIMGKQVELGVQIPTELILSEEKAVETIKAIVGSNPKREDIIMSYAGIEELNASVITSLAQYIGIRHVPIMIEEEKQRMNMGEIYLAGASRDQKTKYEAVAKLMGDVDITTRCKITTLSGWRDKGGNVRIGIGTKEEVLLPHDLLDISRRGAAYIRTKCETKSAKKSIVNALPVTAEGILRKVKKIYHWE